MFRTPSRFQRMGTGVVPAITVQHMEIPMPWTLACTQPYEGRQHLQIATLPLLLLRATRLQTISAFRRLGSSELTTVVHSDAFAVTAENANPLPNTTRKNLITTSLLQLLAPKQCPPRDVVKHGPIQQPINRMQFRKPRENLLIKPIVDSINSHDPDSNSTDGSSSKALFVQRRERRG